MDYLSPGKREGLEFRCPHCSERLKIFFKNPFDDGKPRGVGPWWTVAGGSSLSDLTLFPSVHWLGHCHVHVISGEVHPV